MNELRADWPILPVFAVCVAIASLFARTKAYREALAVEGEEHLTGIDSLRGVLAALVMLSHAFLFRTLYQFQNWNGETRTQEFIGHGPVGVFFMITAFLFWTKLLRAHGKLDFFRLMRARFRRLAPAYYASIALMLLVAFALSGWRVRVPGSEFITGIIAQLPFGLFFDHPINALRNSSVVNAGVTWSLPYEWAFYIALPALGWFARWPRVIVPCILILVMQRVLPLHPEMTCFVYGMIAAVLYAHEPARAFLRRPVVCAALMIGGLVLVADALTQPHVSKYFGPALIFAAVLFGFDLFGALRSAAMRALGAMSYSLYLFHGIVATVLFAIVNPLQPIASLGDLQFWLLFTAVACASVAVAGIAFVYFERPYLYGRRHVPSGPLVTNAAANR